MAGTELEDHLNCKQTQKGHKQPEMWRLFEEKENQVGYVAQALNSRAWEAEAEWVDVECRLICIVRLCLK